MKRFIPVGLGLAIIGSAAIATSLRPHAIPVTSPASGPQEVVPVAPVPPPAVPAMPEVTPRPFAPDFTVVPAVQHSGQGPAVRSAIGGDDDRTVTQARRRVRRGRHHRGPRYVYRHHKRSGKHSAYIIGGSTVGGALIGGAIGGKKGALIGGLVGGGAGTVYDRKTRRRVRVIRRR